MRLARQGWGSPALLLLALILMPVEAIHASSARAEVAKMVRLLGYGGAIHNFKNYVLRGDHREEYGSIAQAHFNGVLNIISGLDSNSQLNSKDRQALADIKKTVQAYLAGIQRIKELFEKGWRLEDIDRVVIVDDDPALEGLQWLRAKWQWSPIEQVEYQLGYGGGIHHFKNYVLRSSDAYYTHALENFLAVESLLAGILADTGLSQQQRVDLDAIERVSHAYMEYLVLVERLQRMQRPVRQIDLAVKVNDRLAQKALKKFRED